MKKTGLAKALQSRLEPESTPEPVTQAPPAPQEKERRRRFHTSVYLNRKTYDQIRIGLLKEGEARDFNGLVIDLLKEWYEAAQDSYGLEDWQDEGKSS